MSYTYHSSVPGLRTGLTAQQPSGTWSQSYAYDAAKRLQTLTAPMGSFSYTFQGPGNLWTNLALPNTSKIIQTFDNVARLTGTHLKNSSGSTLNSHAFLYNTAHQRTRHTRTDASYVSFTYDNISQLLTAVGSGGQSTENLGYLYDPAWNLNVRTNNGAPTSFSVNGKNELTAVGSVNYFYDGNGNLSSTSDYRSYSYDDENQLTKVEQYQSWKTEFTYDGRQRLRVRKEFTWNAGYGAWQLSGETRYVYDGMLLLQERNSGNTPTVAYTRGVDLSGSLHGAGGIGGLLARYRHATTSPYAINGASFYHADGNGNVTYLAGTSGAADAAYRYDPFGRWLAQTGSYAAANVMRFSSKPWIAHNGSSTDGLYYYGYHFYDPNLQRWPNRDPLGEFAEETDDLWESFDELQANLYGYVGNDPLNWVDPDGLQRFRPPKVKPKLKTPTPTRPPVKPPTNRGGLRDNMGKPPPGDVQAHHEFPCKHRDWFAQRGIDCNNPKYGKWAKTPEHQQWSPEYGKAWDDFIAEFPNAPWEDVMEQLLKMRKKYRDRYIPSPK